MFAKRIKSMWVSHDKYVFCLWFVTVHTWISWIFTWKKRLSTCSLQISLFYTHCIVGKYYIDISLKEFLSLSLQKLYIHILVKINVRLFLNILSISNSYINMDMTILRVTCSFLDISSGVLISTREKFKVEWRALK